MPSTTAPHYEILASGVIDQSFTAPTLEEASQTLWRSVHLKSTPSAWEPMSAKASHNVAFGQKNVAFPIPRQADLVYSTFAKVHIPGIVGLSVSGGVHTVITGVDNEPYWTNAIGQYVLEQSRLVVGNQEIATILNHTLFAWEELAGKPGKRLLEMIGKFDTIALRQSQSRRSRDLYVPLPTHWSENTGLSLPMTSLQFHTVTINFDFAALSTCIVRPSGFPASGANVYVRADGLTNAEIEAASIPAVVANSDLDVELEVFGVYLDNAERSLFAHGQFEQIMSEFQHQSFNITQTVTSATESTAPKYENLRLTLANVIQEYIVLVRRGAHETANDWFNFSGHDDSVTDTFLDPIKDMAVKFSNKERVGKRPGKFFRMVVPYVVHTNIPREFIYVWSYAVEPEDYQPTQGCNHSRIPDISIDVWLDSRIFVGSSNVNVFVIARAKNLLRFKYGLLTKRHG